MPLDIWVVGPTETDVGELGPIEFTSGSLTVQATVLASAPVRLDSAHDDWRYRSEVSAIEFVMPPPPSYDPHAVLAHVLPTINRFRRCLRNFGEVSRITEVHPDERDAETYLRRWQVSLEDGGEWKRLVEDSPLLDAFRRVPPVQSDGGVIHIDMWDWVEEALEAGLEPGPELEFYANAKGELAAKDYRHALLEAVICLEIVLSQYLRAYLRHHRGFSNKRINRFVNAQLTLGARVSGVLDLTAGRHTDIPAEDVSKVIKVVGWRNAVVHKTGHLPDHLTPEEIEEGIDQVLFLAHYLAGARDRIEGSKELEAIRQALAGETSAVVSLWRAGRRSFEVTLRYVFTSEIPPETEMLRLTELVGAGLERLDPRFVPRRHLEVRFEVFPSTTVARWSRGVLDVESP